MKILFLMHRYYYDHKTSRGRVLYGEAVWRQPGIDLRFWGPGWDGYDESLSLPQNCESIKWQSDVIWSYKCGGHDGFGHARDVYKSAPVRLVTFNEANDENMVMDEVGRPDANLVVFHHGAEADLWKTKWNDRRVLHVPHGAAQEVFYKAVDAIWHARPTVCLVAGTLNPTVYPLRCRWAKLVASGMIPGRVRQHPGTRMAGLDHVERQLADYAEELQHAKIALCCSSIHRYALQKYVEAAAAGCVLIGDMPDDEEFRGTLGRHLVSFQVIGCVDSAAPDSELARVVSDVISDPQALQDLALATQEAYLTGLTTDHYAKRLISELRGCSVLRFS